MTYVDGFVLCVPKNRLDEYKAMAEKAGRIWKKYGALSYTECVAEDTGETGFCLTFPQLANPQEGEIVVFSYITYTSRAHRDEVNAKVMADKELMEGHDENNMPFDAKRMAYGGFETIVSF